MAIKTRKESREALGALLNTEMTTCQEVNDYFKSDLAGKSPVLCLHSLGTGVPEGGYTFQGLRPVYDIDVIVFVKRGGEDITEAKAEDELDDVAQQLFETVESNRKTTDWEWLHYTEPSGAIEVDIGGAPYWMEVTRLAIEVFRG